MAFSLKAKHFKLVPSAQTTSHLYLNGREINEEDIDLDAYNYKNLKVLYLHKNNINTIKNLNGITTLTHLYLQWNNIQKIENIDKLENLQKLYLGYNQINKLENIDNLINLKELHIEGQRLPKDIKFTINVSNLSVVVKSLQILNVGRLNLEDLSQFRVFSNLKVLTAPYNLFQDPHELGKTLGEFKYLKKANLNGCPAQKDNHYRIKITAGACNLEYLDDKFIPKTSRVFIKRMEQFRHENQSKTSSAIIKNQGDGGGDGDGNKQEPQNRSINKKSSENTELQHKSLLLNKTEENISFRPWNSLTFIKKPMRMNHKKASSNNLLPIVAEHEYHLQGQNIL